MTEYFSHDYDTRNDEKVMDLMSELGWEGYGIFWGIVELLYQNDGVMQSNYKRIAFALHTNETIVESVVESFQLFELGGEEFWSESVLNRLKERNAKSEKARQSANSRWNKANVKRAHNDSNAKKESKGEEKKESKETKVKILLSELDSSDSLTEYENISFSFWQLAKHNIEKYNINSTNLKNSKIKTWVDPIRLAIESDKRTIEEFREIFNFLKNEIPNAKGFSWSKNIRSTVKLREKFEDLLLASRSNSKDDYSELKDEIIKTMQS
jgi:hypothetical protein